MDASPNLLRNSGCCSLISPVFKPIIPLGEAVVRLQVGLAFSYSAPVLRVCSCVALLWFDRSPLALLPLPLELAHKWIFGQALELTATDAQTLEFIEQFTRDAPDLQQRILEDILRSNAGTDYFTRHGIHGIPCREEFLRKMPLISYTDIEADIQRIAAGDTSKILCSAPVETLLSSSGTSGGKQKLFPKLPSYDPEFVVLNRVARAKINEQVPYANTGKSMSFIYIRAPGKTAGGITTSSGLSGYFTSPAFRGRKVDPERGFTSPDEVIACMDYEQASYCHLLCGLAQRHDVTRLGAVFASTFTRTFKTFQDRWPQLYNDIRSRRVSASMIPDATLRDAVDSVLAELSHEEAQELASVVLRECRRPSWAGIVTRIWPNARLVESIITGSMRQYVATIDMLSGGLPIASCLYAGSECSTLGVNLSPLSSPEQVSYALFPSFAFYEFLPVTPKGLAAPPAASPRTVRRHRLQQQQELRTAEELVDLANVELGREYELVLTTKAGLYRYQVGDVLKVVGFKNSQPLFAFVRRSGVLLSVDTDKTDELELHIGVTRACNSLRRLPRVIGSPHVGPLRLVDYTSRVELAQDGPGRYVLYWELNHPGLIHSNVELQACCTAVESSLSDVYKRNRKEGIIAPLCIKVVKSNTFVSIVDYVVAHKNGSIAQYKTPRCVKDSAMIDLLESRVVMTAYQGP